MADPVAFLHGCFTELRSNMAMTSTVQHQQLKPDPDCGLSKADKLNMQTPLDLRSIDWVLGPAMANLMESCVRSQSLKDRIMKSMDPSASPPNPSTSMASVESCNLPRSHQLDETPLSTSSELSRDSCFPTMSLIPKTHSLTCHNSISFESSTARLRSSKTDLDNEARDSVRSPIIIGMPHHISSGAQVTRMKVGHHNRLLSQSSDQPRSVSRSPPHTPELVPSTRFKRRHSSADQSPLPSYEPRLKVPRCPRSPHSITQSLRHMADRPNSRNRLDSQSSHNRFLEDEYHLDPPEVYSKRHLPAPGQAGYKPIRSNISSNGYYGGKSGRSKAISKTHAGNHLQDDYNQADGPGPHLIRKDLSPRLLDAIRAHQFSWSTEQIIIALCEIGWDKEDRGIWRKTDWKSIYESELKEYLQAGNPSTFANIIKASGSPTFTDALRALTPKNQVYVWRDESSGKRRVQLGKDFTPIGFQYRPLVKSLRHIWSNTHEPATTSVIHEAVKAYAFGLRAAELMPQAKNFEEYLEQAEKDGVVTLSVDLFGKTESKSKNQGKGDEGIVKERPVTLVTLNSKWRTPFLVHRS